jgi:DNA-binding NarL/FixJ family response regulator
MCRQTFPPTPSALLFIVNADACQGSADDLVHATWQRFDSSTRMRTWWCWAHASTPGCDGCLQAGADAYILETLTPDALVKSLELIMLGATVLPAEFSHAHARSKELGEPWSRSSLGAHAQQRCDASASGKIGRIWRLAFSPA